MESSQKKPTNHENSPDGIIGESDSEKPIMFFEIKTSSALKNYTSQLRAYKQLTGNNYVKITRRVA